METFKILDFKYLNIGMSNSKYIKGYKKIVESWRNFGKIKIVVVRIDCDDQNVTRWGHQPNQ